MSHQTSNNVSFSGSSTGATGDPDPAHWRTGPSLNYIGDPLPDLTSVWEKWQQDSSGVAAPNITPHPGPLGGLALLPCIVCGSECEELLLCELCRQAVVKAREAMLGQMLTDLEGDLIEDRE
jgi:hypothetical protein